MEAFTFTFKDKLVLHAPTVGTMVCSLRNSLASTKIFHATLQEGSKDPQDVQT